MNKSKMKQEIKKLGFGNLFIENSDTDKDQIRLSCEDNSNNGELAGDYYDGVYFGWTYFGINPTLVAYANKYNLYWEWENPAVITLWLSN